MTICDDLLVEQLAAEADLVTKTAARDAAIAARDAAEVDMNLAITDYGASVIALSTAETNRNLVISNLAMIAINKGIQGCP